MTAVEDSADRELKARHRSMWAMGDYPAVAADVIPLLGTRLIEASGVKKGDALLDVACGSGNASIPAALRGARVTGCDLTPALLRAAERLAVKAGVEIDWCDCDAEALPFPDDSFDVVVSCLGAMFAPRHQTCADELKRVCRGGGTIGLANWTPNGFIGEMFAVMKPFAPPSPSGVQPPPLWGNEDHVRELLGEEVVALTMERERVTVDTFQTPEAFRDYFKTNYGPTIAAYKVLGEDAERIDALDEELCALARRHDSGKGQTVMEWEYLLITARLRQ
jgi:ubiquinone/menaquinone biosynthesis C-methylase UbiE